MQSSCRTWPLNGSCRIRAKQKHLRKHKGACTNSWSRIGSLKSFTLTIPWNLAKLVKIFPGIIVRRRHTDRKQMGLQKEQYAESRKVRLQYCCNQSGWKLVGRFHGMLCGKLHTKGGLENHSEYPSSVWFTGWVLPYFCEKTSQESINLERKSLVDCSLDTLCTRGEFGWVT